MLHIMCSIMVTNIVTNNYVVLRILQNDAGIRWCGVKLRA